MQNPFGDLQIYPNFCSGDEPEQDEEQDSRGDSTEAGTRNKASGRLEDEAHEGEGA